MAKALIVNNDTQPLKISLEEVANAFISCALDSGHQLFNNKLQKLVYIANGYHLGFTGKSIFYDRVDIYAWCNIGPVIPVLYNKFRKFGDGTVKKIKVYSPLYSSRAIPDFIFSIYNAYQEFSGVQLTKIVCLEGTPYWITWNKKPFSIIKEKLIRDYYKNRLEDVRG